MWKPSVPARFRREHKPKITPGLKYVPTSGSSDLWWVKVILNVGRPVVAVFVLVMCAPGEHYLARKAGWSEWLAWGMPATLTAYAGIAAVVATKRPKGAPGKSTAVWGAVVSVLLAMAAQPVAHLYGKTGLDVQQVTLTVIVSCIPALVFGHLLHMAAAPVHVPDKRQDTDDDIRDKIADALDVPRDMLGVDNPTPSGRRSQLVINDEHDGLDDLEDAPGGDAFRYVPGDEDDLDTGTDASIDYLRREQNTITYGDMLRRNAQADIDRPRPTAGLWTAPVGTEPPETDDVPSPPWRGYRADLVIVDDVPQPEGDIHPVRFVTPSRPNGTRTGTSVTGRVRTALEDNPGLTDDDIRDKFAGEDIRPNTINKAIKRIREETREENGS